MYDIILPTLTYRYVIDWISRVLYRVFEPRLQFSRLCYLV
jgi:hypothetical protein